MVVTSRPRAATATAPVALPTPWLAHARRCMFGALDDLAEPDDLDEDLWIEWHLPALGHSTGDVWMLTLETIELLDLLIHADYRAGWTFILEVLKMPVYLSLLDELSRKIYPKHTIAWTDLSPQARGGGASSLARAEQLVMALPANLHAPMFHQAKAALVERCGNAERDRIRVCFKLEMTQLAPDIGEMQALEDLATLAMLAQDPTRRTLREELKRVGPVASDTTGIFPVTGNEEISPFVFSRVAINASGVALTDRMLASISAIHRCGVQVFGLTLGRSHFSPSDVSPEATTVFLRSLVVSSPATHMALSIGHGMGPSVFQAFCSALAVTRTINDVTFTTQARLPHYWSWIAYAIFSRDVSHSIQYIHLDVVTLTHDDVAEFQRVLSANDPLAAIAPTSQTVITDDCVDRLKRDPEVVDVNPNTTCLVSTRDDGGADLAVVSISADGCTDLRVVDDSLSHGHVCVLYPGAGLCFIRRDAVVARRRLAPPPPPPTRRPFLFDRISLEVGNETPLAALGILIQLVGPCTRILMFYSPHRAVLPDSFLRDVLVACPRLERLDLTMVTISSFSWLLESDAAVRIPPSLTLTYVRCLDADGYTQLVAGLRDSETVGLGHSLQELAIHTHLRVLRRLWPDLLGMLTMNLRLHRVLMRTDISSERPDDLERPGQHLRLHNGDPLYGREKPLAQRNRLALISVFSHISTLPDLDTAMLAIIFALAAPNRRRVCDLMQTVVRPDN